MLSPALEAGLIRFTFPILKVRPWRDLTDNSIRYREIIMLTMIKTMTMPTWSRPPQTVMPQGTAVDGLCRSKVRMF